MKRLSATIAVVLLAASVVLAGDQRGQGAERRDDATRGDNRTAPTVHADLRVVFSSGDLVVIREHYRTRYQNLPPGLRKKLARTGQLPPGWQKKMEAFPVDLERRLPPLPEGYKRGVIDAHAVIYLPGTGVTIDAAVLF